MNEEITLAIAEDHGLVRAGFVRMLNDYSDIKIVFEASNGQELLRNLTGFKPAIVLLDIVMPVVGGLKAMTLMKEKYPKIKVIALSAFAEEMSIIEYVRSGARAFLNKDCDVEDLIKSIRIVWDKGFYFDAHMTKILAKHGVLPTGLNEKRVLTEREINILKLMSLDATSSVIAEKMKIKEITVEWYKHIMLQKTKCKDSKDLIQFAKENNLL